MATESLNPFAEFGTIVTGNNFIGRKNELSTISQRVLGKAYGNLAIVGLPRIGKSCLAWNCIMERRDELEKENTIPIFFSVATCKSAISFFRKLASMVDSEIEFICTDERYAKFAKPALNRLHSESETDDLSSLVKPYFRFIKRLGFKIIAILDEFDAAQDMFSTADFQTLRELVYDPDVKICAITTSRKTIEDIELLAKNGGISNLAGVFTMLRLSGYNTADVNEYWDAHKSSWEVSEEFKEKVDYYSGGHPWLMDMINYKAYLEGQSTESFFENFEDIKIELMEALDKMISTLGNEKLLDPAIQLVVGPMSGVDTKQEEKLLKYGFIRKVSIFEKEVAMGGFLVGPTWDNNTTAYCCFSDYATLDLYRRYYANVPYNSLWSDTENLLRSIIKEYLAKNFSENWMEEMNNKLSTNPPFPAFNIQKWETNLANLQKNAQNMQNRFPNSITHHLVDYTLTSQIFTLFIKVDWTWYSQRIFKGKREDWFKKFDFLTNLRDPVAHNNPMDIEEEKRIAREYCNEICAAIHNWHKAKAKDKS